MFGMMVQGSPVGAAELLTAEIVPVGGGSPLFTVNWTLTGNVAAYTIYIAAAHIPGGANNTYYNLINPNLLTFDGDVTGFVDFVGGDTANNYDFEIGLIAAGPTQAAGSPIYLSPPF